MGGNEREGRKKSKTTRLIERVMECCTTEAMNELKKYVGSGKILTHTRFARNCWGCRKLLELLMLPQAAGTARDPGSRCCVPHASIETASGCWNWSRSGSCWCCCSCVATARSSDCCYCLWNPGFNSVKTNFFFSGYLMNRVLNLAGLLENSC
ncbi:hypothetical protein CICLE_v10017066mg [Citrus x clementina]|uniref:Uncharacterized protein n=1 Tax=Citrus clementina TaxID=85681 RepID=V4TQZ4_CITCL|nr:hypothetical protein CICLE_v10017066mg [Citrus x clementina]